MSDVARPGRHFRALAAGRSFWQGGGVSDAIESFLEFSPVSRGSVEAFPEWRGWLEAAVEDSVPRTRGRLRVEVDGWLKDADGLDAALDRLREFKRREMLRIGARDWAGVASLDETMGALSALADECIARVASLCLARVQGRRGEPGTGWMVLGLGKLGGGELNYSSDVDLMLVYDEDGDAAPGFTRHEWFNEWGKLFVSKFAQRTASGGLFRIDMRLRPDGDSGPLARSMESCENYYAAFGETWERLALMKARCCAGDPELAYQFGVMLQPFCYPKLLSQQVLDEVGRIKERIENELLDSETRLSDVKRGVGGIREIEFVLQVLQLLNGGRQPYLQTAGTRKALDAVAQMGLMPPESVAVLREAYAFWRRIEHRIQMVDERQTHVIPSDPEQRWRIARSLGFAGPQEFDAACERQRSGVRRLFDELVRVRSGEQTGGPEAPAAPRWEWLGEAGRRLIEGMREGPAFSNISPRTRQQFDRLEPLLEENLRRLVEPAQVLAGLGSFIERYGARGQLYETWLSNPRVLELLVRLFDASERFRDVLVSNPDWLESICRAGGIDAVLGAGDYDARASAQGDIEALRSWRWEEGLRIAIQDALGLIDAEQRELEHTGLAQACVRWLCERAGGGLAVIGAGKLGGWELSYGSDLDLVFVNGEADAVQHLLRSLSEGSAHGVLYKADARLRPEGEKGVLAPDPALIEKYYRERAQTWEFLAFTKFRHVAGDEGAARAALDAVKPLWEAHGRDPEFVGRMLDMKKRIERERDRGCAPELRLKTGRGGLMDVEMAVQCWQLRRARPETRTRAALALMAEELPEDAAALREAYEVLRRVESVHRRFDFQSAACLPGALDAREALARRAGFGNEAAMMTRLGEIRGLARASFDRVMQRLRR